MADHRTSPDTVVLDLDGTLVDSVYAHTLAWQQAFRDVGVSVPGHRLHRLIGTGGDRLVTAATSAAVEDSVGDDVRARHRERFTAMVDQLVPAEGADRLLDALARHGFRVVLASSGDAELTELLLDRLDGGQQLLQQLVTGSDAEESKPSGELVEVALRSVEADRAVVVGDATWDVHAAHDAGVPAIGVLTGGYSEAELREAGAVAVHDSPGDLADLLDDHRGLLPRPAPNR